MRLLVPFHRLRKFPRSSTSKLGTRITRFVHCQIDENPGPIRRRERPRFPPILFLENARRLTPTCVLIEGTPAVAATAGQTSSSMLRWKQRNSKYSRVSRIEIASGETSKSTDVNRRYGTKLIECEADRRTVVIKPSVAARHDAPGLC